MSMKMEFGSCEKSPHHAVVGDPSCYYVWINERGRGSESNWIIGKKGFNDFYILKKLLKKKDKIAFIDLIKQLHEENL